MQIRPSRTTVALFGTLALLFACGCGPPLADVQGTVSYNGTPVEKGMVTFTPTGDFGTIVGSNIENGKFNAKGVFAGQNLVVVVATKNVKFSQNTEDMATTAPPDGPNGANTNWKDPADVIPSNAEGNNSAYDFKAGKNTLEIQLSTPKSN